MSNSYRRVDQLVALAQIIGDLEFKDDEQVAQCVTEFLDLMGAAKRELALTSSISDIALLTLYKLLQTHPVTHTPGAIAVCLN